MPLALGSLGLAWLLLQVDTRRRVVGTTLLAGGLCVGAALCIQPSSHWQNEITLWRETRETAPQRVRSRHRRYLCADELFGGQVSN
ncbi:MAG: hypothetical protein VX911_11515 [Candidatus Latescibacterota bacterium]|nr:hypothetical protein [Candidatus Latescibacterota bacterium]